MRLVYRFVTIFHVVLLFFPIWAPWCVETGKTDFALASDYGDGEDRFAEHLTALRACHGASDVCLVGETPTCSVPVL